MAEATALLEVHDVTKSFGAVAAVQGVSFPLYGGEAHALVGENGAGKSTIVKMLAGVHRPDTGTLRVNGSDAEFAGPADAKAAGIAVIALRSIWRIRVSGWLPIAMFSATDRSGKSVGSW